MYVVFFNAGSGSVAYARMRRIDYRAGLLFSATGIPGAIVGAMTTDLIPRRAFNVVFGILITAGAIALLFTRPSEDTAAPSERGRPAATPHTRTRLGMALSFFVGYFSSLLGIGGGVMHVPILARVLKFPVHVATATSHFILALLALAGVIVHLLDGTLAPAGMWQAAWLSLGAVAGAQVGAILSRHVGGKWIMRGLAAALALVGVRILVLAAGR